MRGPLYFGAAAAVAATAFWAYRVNYAAQEALGRVEALRAEIAHEREALAILRADWAWLNAPDRLARLVALKADTLALGPMTAESFAELAELPEPPPDTFWARAHPDVFALDLSAPPGAPPFVETMP
jgi:hypothetical protein